MLKKTLIIVGAIVGGLIALAVVGSFLPDGAEAPDVPAVVVTVTATPTHSPTPESEPVEYEEPEPVEPEMTTGQEQAIVVAEEYLDYMDFSEKELTDQLKYEGFTTNEAEFAIDYLDPNWKAEAVECAEAYMDMGGFSRQSLLEQLLYEEYTRSQAEYAVDKVY